MRTARGASMRCILGASLIAFLLPLMAVAETSDSNARAISGGSVTGISGGSTLGISGGSTLGISGGSTLGISGGSTAGLILAGPVEGIDSSSGFFSSMGQRVFAPAGVLSGLQLGDYVMVSGQISGAGTIEADAVAQSGQVYVPGSSAVFVTGIPSSVDFNFGIAMIGELKVDYTSSLGGSGFEGIGAAITVIGTQPALGGTMLSDRVYDQTELFLRD